VSFAEYYKTLKKDKLENCF